MAGVTIGVCNDTSLDVPAEHIRTLVMAILRDAGVQRGSVSVAIVSDETIHGLNKQFLEHDYATDVLSFLLDRDGDELGGEIVASADTAQRVATELGCNAADELLLYVVHGALHLVGHDDADDAQRADMRGAERRYLAMVGISPADR